MFTNLQKDNTIGNRTKILSVLLLLIGIGVVFTIAIKTRVKFPSSDPRFSLLVSQSILQNGTIRLDNYMGSQYVQSAVSLIDIKNGHDYDFHPIGTSVFCLPIVWVADLAGDDMLLPKDDMSMQLAIAAVLCSLIFLLVFKIARLWLAAVPAFVISAVSSLGTTYATMATALWSFDFEIFFLCLSFLLIAQHQTNKKRSINPYLLGFFLFSAYLCRPSANIFIVLTFIYVLLFKRDIFFKLALTAGSLLLAFMFFSYQEFHQILPDYYLLGISKIPLSHGQSMPPFGLKTFWLGLYSNTFGPSRGIFIFSPFLLLVFAACIIYFKNLRRNPLFWFALASFLLYLFTLSAFPCWWFGEAYGPRTFVDGFLPLIILTIFVWLEISKSGHKIYKRAFSYGFFVLASLALFINTKQGLYNGAVVEWNFGVDQHPQYVLDWRFPQFLASYSMVRERLAQRRIDQYGQSPDGLQPYHPGEDISSDDIRHAAFRNFIGGPSGLMSDRGPAAIIFRLGDIDENGDYLFQIKGNAPIQLVFGVNGFIIAPVNFSNGIAQFFIPREVLLENSYNIVEFVPQFQDIRTTEMHLTFKGLSLSEVPLGFSKKERDISWFELLPDIR